jgi:hypothetical protein
MKRLAILSCVLVFAQMHHVALSQIGFTVGYEPYRMDRLYYEMIASGELDRSEVKSKITLDQKESKNAVSLGARLNLPFEETGSILWTAHVQGGFIFFNSINAFQLMLSLEPEFTTTKSISPFFGVGIDVHSLFGKVGEVGEREGDFFLEAPDGRNYPVGSTISVKTNLLFGVSSYIGIKWDISREYRVFVYGGYKVAPTADKWTFEIEDRDDSNKKTELPTRGFERQPSAVGLSSFFARVGFDFMILR